MKVRKSKNSKNEEKPKSPLNQIYGISDLLVHIFTFLSENQFKSLKFSCHLFNDIIETSVSFIDIISQIRLKKYEHMNICQSYNELKMKRRGINDGYGIYSSIRSCKQPLIILAGRKIEVWNMDMNNIKEKEMKKNDVRGTFEGYVKERMKEREKYYKGKKECDIAKDVMNVEYIREKDLIVEVSEKGVVRFRNSVFMNVEKKINGLTQDVNEYITNSVIVVSEDKNTVVCGINYEESEKNKKEGSVFIIIDSIQDSYSSQIVKFKKCFHRMKMVKSSEDNVVVAITVSKKDETSSSYEKISRTYVYKSDDELDSFTKVGKNVKNCRGLCLLSNNEVTCVVYMSEKAAFVTRIDKKSKNSTKEIKLGDNNKDIKVVKTLSKSLFAVGYSDVKFYRTSGGSRMKVEIWTLYKRGNGIKRCLTPIQFSKGKNVDGIFSHIFQPKNNSFNKKKKILVFGASAFGGEIKKCEINAEGKSAPHHSGSHWITDSSQQISIYPSNIIFGFSSDNDDHYDDDYDYGNEYEESTKKCLMIDNNQELLYYHFCDRNSEVKGSFYTHKVYKPQFIVKAFKHVRKAFLLKELVVKKSNSSDALPVGQFLVKTTEKMK